MAAGGATPAPPPPGTEQAGQTVTQSADFGANAVAQGTGQTAQTTTTEAAKQTLTQQAGQFAKDAAPALAAGGVTTLVDGACSDPGDAWCAERAVWVGIGGSRP